MSAKALAVALLFCMGCSPLHYVRKAPIVPPSPVEAPELTYPTLESFDCPRYTLTPSTGEWSDGAWGDIGGSVEVILPQDKHPAVGRYGKSKCRHIVLAPGWWVTAREARDRYPLVRKQLALWRGYSERAAERHQKESEEIAKLLNMARKRQVESAIVGAGAGAGAMTVLMLVLLLASR
jgi:hypothetical protein